jgi:hypothetical protein
MSKPGAKNFNKKLKRNRNGLTSKCHKYGKLEGVELALFIRYPRKGEFYSYRSSDELTWLDQIPTMVRVLP